MQLNDPWLVSIWPGMGSVALTAGTYLTSSLGAERIGRLSTAGFFDVDKVEIDNGVARVASGPSCEFFAWKAPSGGRDLLFFVGESQPNSRGYEFCDHLLAEARRYGVSRVFTFAAMATQVHPTARPRVFGVVNDAALLPELEEGEVDILSEGQISGLNGVMLAAAVEHQLPAVCLLGEMPFFAVGVPNPKASLRVLEEFCPLANLELDFSELSEQADHMERNLVELMDRMSAAVQGMPPVEGEFEADLGDLEDFTTLAGEALGSDVTPEAINPEERARVERLFLRAREDRQEAMRLKQELDRLGVFEEYEDRFLDLFRQGE